MRPGGHAVGPSEAKKWHQRTRTTLKAATSVVGILSTRQRNQPHSLLKLPSHAKRSWPHVAFPSPCLPRLPLRPSKSALSKIQPQPVLVISLSIHPSIHPPERPKPTSTAEPTRNKLNPRQYAPWPFVPFRPSRILSSSFPIYLYSSSRSPAVWHGRVVAGWSAWTVVVDQKEGDQSRSCEISISVASSRGLLGKISKTK